MLVYTRSYASLQVLRIMVVSIRNSKNTVYNKEDRAIFVYILRRCIFWVLDCPLQDLGWRFSLADSAPVCALMIL